MRSSGSVRSLPVRKSMVKSTRDASASGSAARQVMVPCTVIT